jgi:hypothetical protein
VESTLTRLDEFGALVETVRAETSRATQSLLPELLEQSAQLERAYFLIDKLDVSCTSFVSSLLSFLLFLLLVSSPPLLSSLPSLSAHFFSFFFLFSLQRYVMDLSRTVDILERRMEVAEDSYTAVSRNKTFGGFPLGLMGLVSAFPKPLDLFLLRVPLLLTVPFFTFSYGTQKTMDKMPKWVPVTIPDSAGFFASLKEPSPTSPSPSSTSSSSLPPSSSSSSSSPSILQPTQAPATPTPLTPNEN